MSKKDTNNQPTRLEELPRIDIQRYEALRDRISGVLLGGAIADALGWSTEFIKSEKQIERIFGTRQISDFKPWEKKTGGRFNTYIDYIQPGEYSDDTQLTLSTSRCIKADGSFDATRFSKQELPYWLQYARGAGGTITRASKAISRKSAEWNNNFFSFESRGRFYHYTEAGANGGAMRISPHVLANINDEITALRGIIRNVIITHGHPRAIWGGLLYGKCLLMLLSDYQKSGSQFIDNLYSFVTSFKLSNMEEDIKEWEMRWAEHTGNRFEDAFNQTREEVEKLLSVVKKTMNTPINQVYDALGCFSPSTRGSGTSTVIAAIAIFLRHGGNYEKAVIRAVNMLGSDTDTIGSMIGAMIGALKGHITIPDRWINVMQDYGYFIRCAEALTRIALREATANDLIVDRKRELVESKNRDIVSLAQSRQIFKGQRVTHPIFGLGWVLDANSQQIHRRGGGTILLTRVAFDTGQSCVFHSYQSGKKRSELSDSLITARKRIQKLL